MITFQILSLICFKNFKAEKVYPELGVTVIEIGENTVFTSNSVEIHWTRIITNPCEIIEIQDIYKTYPCLQNHWSFKRQHDDDVSDLENQIALFKTHCFSQWQSLINEIQSITHTDDEQERELSRSRRSPTLIGLLGFSSIVANIVGVGSTLHSLFSHF